MGLLMTCPRFAIFLFILTSLTFHILFICYPQATYSLCDALNLQFNSCLSAFPVQFSAFFLHGTNSIWIHGTTQMESLPLVFTSTLDPVWSQGGSPESVSGWPPTAGLVLDLKSSCYVSSSWLHVSQGHTSHRLCLVNDSVEDKGRSILADSGPCKVWLCLTDPWVLIDLPETEQKSRKPSPTCSSFCLSDLHHDPTASQISPFPPCIHSQAFPLGKALHI